MIKVEILTDEQDYRGRAKLKRGMVGYLTKETQAVTQREVESGDVVGQTRVCFAAGLLGYEGREPIFCWVDDKNFKAVK